MNEPVAAGLVWAPTETGWWLAVFTLVFAVGAIALRVIGVPTVDLHAPTHFVGITDPVLRGNAGDLSAAFDGAAALLHQGLRAADAGQVLDGITDEQRAAAAVPAIDPETWVVMGINADDPEYMPIPQVIEAARLQNAEVDAGLACGGQSL